MQGSTSYAYSSSAVEPAYINTESSKNTRIADEKRARKAVEEDAARLQNRVQTLQKEEQKAQKRLEETRLKAQDLLALRAQNEQKQLEREERHRQQQVRGHAIGHHIMTNSTVMRMCCWLSVLLTWHRQACALSTL